MSYSRLEYLFQRYLDNASSKEELEELFSLIALSKNDVDIKNLLDRSWAEFADIHQMNDDKADEIFANIISQNEYPQPSERYSFGIFFKVAAAILLVVSVGLFQYLNSSSNRFLVSTKELKTDREHRRIQLPDGSTVVLNTGSTLSYPNHFAADRREVELIGEGYFDIKHDSKRPFIVHTEKIITTVLGTAFNIKAYAKDKNITVTVTRGKVKVGDTKELFSVIEPNQQLKYNTDQKMHQQLVVNAQETIEWQKNDIFFQNTSMKEAALELEQRFGQKIFFAKESLKDCRFTVTFVKGESLERILGVICSFNNVTYSFEKDKSVLINGPGCAQ